MHKGPRRNNPCVREIQYHSKITMDRVAPISMSGRVGTDLLLLLFRTPNKKEGEEEETTTQKTLHTAHLQDTLHFFFLVILLRLEAIVSVEHNPNSN